jgi:hypothetical protein
MSTLALQRKFPRLQYIADRVCRTLINLRWRRMLWYDDKWLHTVESVVLSFVSVSVLRVINVYLYQQLFGWNDSQSYPSLSSSSHSNFVSKETIWSSIRYPTGGWFVMQIIRQLNWHIQSKSTMFVSAQSWNKSIRYCQ